MIATNYSCRDCALWLKRVISQALGHDPRRRDALAAIIPALPIPAHPDLNALPFMVAARTACPGWPAWTAPTC